MSRLSSLFFMMTVIGAEVMDTNAATTTWSFADCINHAHSHNVSLQKSRISERISDYDLEAAEAQWLPSLDFATTHSYTNAPFSAGNKNAYSSNYGFNAGWTVWNGGIRQKNIKRNQIQSEIQKLITSDLFRSIETDILTIYMNILYAQESIRIYEETVALSKAQMERSEALMKSGRASKVDHAQLQSQYEQDYYTLVAAQGTYATRCMELKKILELGINDTIAVEEPKWNDSDVITTLPPIDESYNMAMAVDVYMQSLQKEVSAADLDIAVAKASRYPDISLNAGIGTGYYNPGDTFGKQFKRAINESVGLTLSVPILDNKKSKVAVAKAKADKLSKQLDLDYRETEIAQNMEKWYVDVQSSQAKYMAAIEQEKAAEVSNALVNEQFRLGLVNPVELMTAHNNLLEARHARLQAKYMAILGKKMIEFYRTASISMP